MVNSIIFNTIKMSTKSRNSNKSAPCEGENRKPTAMRTLSDKIFNKFPNLKSSNGDSSSSSSLSPRSSSFSAGSFRRKKPPPPDEDYFEPITDMSAYYLKFCELRLPGLKETIETANKIYNHHKPYLKSHLKSLISIDKQGILIKETVPAIRTNDDDLMEPNPVGNQENTEIETLYKSRRIIYCGVDKLHQRLFVFNYQHGARPENIQIHVIVCKTKDDAKTIAKVLNKIFQVINKASYQNEKEERKKHAEAIKDTLITKSSQSLQRFQSYKSTGSGSNESCSVGCGSGEWISDSDNNAVCVSSIA